MLKIEIFGGGCPRCQKTKMNSKEALAQLSWDADIVEVKDQAQILQRGITVTPALAIDGEVKCMGRIPEVEEIKDWLLEKK